MENLPTGWETKDLQAVCEIILGQSPNSQDVNDKGEGLPFYQGKTEFGKMHPTPRNYCTKPKKTAEKNDILLSVRAPVGPTNIANEKLAIGRGLSAIRQIDNITDYKFVYYYFKRIEPWLSLQGTGTTFQAISGQFIKTLQFPLPPLTEQRQIAALLDKHLSSIDTIKSQLNAILPIIKTFRQSVLADAVSGRLIGKKNDFEQIQLKNCVNIENGKRKPVSQKERQKIQGSFPYYGATGIVDYLNDFTHNGIYILVGEDGANLLTKSKDLAYRVQGKIWVNNHAHVLSEKSGFDLEFIKISINAMDLSKWVTGTAQPKLTKAALEKLPISKFTLPEQRQIVATVERLFAQADGVEQHIHHALAQVNDMTQSVLHQAFTGQLTAHLRGE